MSNERNGCHAYAGNRGVNAVPNLLSQALSWIAADASREMELEVAQV